MAASQETGFVLDYLGHTTQGQINLTWQRHPYSAIRWHWWRRKQKRNNYIDNIHTLGKTYHVFVSLAERRRGREQEEKLVPMDITTAMPVHPPCPQLSNHPLRPCYLAQRRPPAPPSSLPVLVLADAKTALLFLPSRFRLSPWAWTPGIH